MFLARICAGVMLLAAGLFAIPATAAVPVSFKIGIAAPTVNMLPLWIGQSSGVFAAHGLNVEIINTDGGSRGLAEVGEGKLQAMTVGLSAVIDANGKGGDYRLIASGANTMSFRVFGASRITGADSLRGKKIGVSAFGSESDSAASLALKQMGLSRNDVTVVEAGGTLKRLQALESGAIAATPLNEPADSQAERDRLPLLVDLRKSLPWIFTAIVVDRKYLQAHRAEMKEFLRAYIESVYIALSNPLTAMLALSSELKDFPPEVIEATYADFKDRAPRDAAPSREGAETMLRELPELGVAVKSKNVADYVDDSLIDELRSEGFFDSVAKRYPVY
jgi:ABC-type nitrate/sulfonate/bicarbonate transport system substrate-binding protein